MLLYTLNLSLMCVVVDLQLSGLCHLSTTSLAVKPHIDLILTEFVSGSEIIKLDKSDKENKGFGIFRQKIFWIGVS